MSREYAIESSKLPLSIRGMLSQPAVRGGVFGGASRQGVRHIGDQFGSLQRDRG